MSFRAWLHVEGMRASAGTDWSLIRYPALRFVGCANSMQVAWIVAREALPGDQISVEGPAMVTWFDVDATGPVRVQTEEREEVRNGQLA